VWPVVDRLPTGITGDQRLTPKGDSRIRK